MKKEQKEGEKRGLRERLSERYGVSSIAAERELIVWRGRKGVTVHGCRKILQYSPIEIRISLGKEVVSIEGERLYCNSFGAGSVTVEGYVRSVSYLPPQSEQRGSRRA